MSSKFTSSIGFKYPTFRDDLLKTGLKWLEGKRHDDNAENLWRIHDSLYDLSGFQSNHPGGESWIRLTKGTDITEAFECHHVKNIAETLLPKYFIKKADLPRNSPFTFYEDGFYRTLKRRIIAELPNLPLQQKNRSKLIIDGLFISYLLLAIFSSIFQSFTVAFLAGIVLSMTSIAAHNFFHQKDNWRMYYFDFTFMESKAWRISHALSHHLYTNTISDLEISMLEPYLQYLPSTEKTFFARYLSWIYSPVFYCLMFFGEFIRTLIECMVFRNFLSISCILPFSVFGVMYLISGRFYFNLILFLWIQMAASVHFAIVGLNAAHHHPRIFHDGDMPRPVERDWGIFQLDAVMDRKDITGSHFLVLTNFGDHALHHLFPTLDHAILEYLYPVFLKTCQEFDVKWRLLSQIELVKGQYLQLAKSQPRRTPPK